MHMKFHEKICLTRSFSRASGIDRRVKSLKMNFLELQFSEITILDHGSRSHHSKKIKFSRTKLRFPGQF